jgi:hypothetical protein
MPSYVIISMSPAGAIELVWNGAMWYLVIDKSLALLLALGLDHTNRCNLVQFRQIQFLLGVHTLLLFLQVFLNSPGLGLLFLRRGALRTIFLAGFADARGRCERRLSALCASDGGTLRRAFVWSHFGKIEWSVLEAVVGRKYLRVAGVELSFTTTRG